jgi:hypothetical protein
LAVIKMLSWKKTPMMFLDVFKNRQAIISVPNRIFVIKGRK